MIDTTALRAFAALKHGEIHKALLAQRDELSQAQRSLRDEVEFRWNQGRQQMLSDIIDTIEGARDEVERIESASRKRRPGVNAF